MPIHLLLFDAVGTLVRFKSPFSNRKSDNNLEAISEIYKTVADQCGIDTSSFDLSLSIHRSLTHSMKRSPNFGYLQNMSSKTWWSEVVVNSLTNMKTKNNATSAQLKVASIKLYDIFSTQQCYIVYPDALEILKRTDNVRKGIVSNNDERLHAVVQDLGIREHFEFLLTSKEVGCEKPNPKIYEAALHQAGVKANETLFVGDDVLNDCIGPMNVGITSLLLKREPYETNNPCKVIKSLLDIETDLLLFLQVENQIISCILVVPSAYH